MRVMYVASNPNEQEGLRLEQDITELQRTLAQTAGTRVDFNFLPALPFEDIEQQIAIFNPDVLHISAHGTERELMLSNVKERQVPLTAETLRALIASHPPKLVLISACTSSTIAKGIVGTVPFAIGVNAPVTNFAARKSAVTLYRVLLRGESLLAAFNASNATLTALSARNDVRANLEVAAGYSATKERLYRLPRIVARLDLDSVSGAAKEWTLQIGLCGALSDTIQVVFATDDESYIVDGKNPYVDMAFVVRTTPVDGEIWQQDRIQEVEGDFRIYALATTADGKCYSVAGTACEALRNFYDVYFDAENGPKYSKELNRILQLLQMNDGAMMRPMHLRGKSKQELQRAKRNTSKRRN
jgi:hypothetical protein